MMQFKKKVFRAADVSDANDPSFHSGFDGQEKRNIHENIIAKKTDRGPFDMKLAIAASLLLWSAILMLVFTLMKIVSFILNGR
ncbi:MAG: hypothetical protein AAF720_15305 [Pseudomonadota bacterium]